MGSYNKQLDCSSEMSSGQLKAHVKTVDMTEEMEKDAIEIASVAIMDYNTEAQQAKYIKTEFDKKHRHVLTPFRAPAVSGTISARITVNLRLSPYPNEPACAAPWFMRLAALRLLLVQFLNLLTRVLTVTCMAHAQSDMALFPGNELWLPSLSSDE